ncbi:hypothetical protein PUN28_018367 [Cardiocondyla obscurior]|uniref:Uncharacterized protein n=1 Tax=Cardiocondyla obscurior TaxID=286306 RepID=A0AAW2EH22_9HYME
MLLFTIKDSQRGRRRVNRVGREPGSRGLNKINSDHRYDRVEAGSSIRRILSKQNLFCLDRNPMEKLTWSGRRQVDKRSQVKLSTVFFREKHPSNYIEESVLCAKARYPILYSERRRRPRKGRASYTGGATPWIIIAE